MAQLKTDYTDQILDASVNTQRRYLVQPNDDGTVSLIDNTSYSQQGDSFGAGDVNATNAVVNTCLQIVSFDASTGHIVTKSANYEG